MTVYKFFVYDKEYGFTLNYSTAILKARELRRICGEENVDVKEEEYEKDHH